MFLMVYFWQGPPPPPQGLMHRHTYVSGLYPCFYQGYKCTLTLVFITTLNQLERVDIAFVLVILEVVGTICLAEVGPGQQLSLFRATLPGLARVARL